MMNGKGIIRLKDALKLMDRLDHKGNPIPFTIQFYTADRRRNEGGMKKEIKGGILSKHNKSLPLYKRNVDGFGSSKSPRHHYNATRNIQAPEGSITKVHIRLIKQFNGMEIVW
ncbi:hypothetical protein DN752_17800 [Echinicola strongylocentroti]|uniref:Uncharacterized protein n=1 Tax=Echinicola strongylocentroti TaxID=1795355 RepID=A0A2Z4ILM5_9BACT|nr:hypothetical protein [Echinicola strongylocentroti]AWW31835.1 hypothetical protein DN752_17800 [Echinicola strongylocentroti]